MIFVAAMLKLQQFLISEPGEVYHRSRTAIQQLSAPIVTSKFVLTAHWATSLFDLDFR